MNGLGFILSYIIEDTFLHLACPSGFQEVFYSQYLLLGTIVFTKTTANDRLWLPPEISVYSRSGMSKAECSVHW